ncbi:RNA polymerase sigma-70 factor [Pedobacter nutrimenti]|uniref:RNA polymerase sigma factor n=1 Tax=Pedobacter nutrimenti TaxID=1241337 RepID=UPI00292DE5F2|nr:RNA polymerase sigma-70 factor [Pedobacter nutrimenti]
MLTKNSSDEDLWVAIVNNDSDAFGILLNRYWKKLFITAHSYLKDNEACESIVQDIFIYLWENRKRLKIDSFEKYMNASARYSVYKRLKSLKLSKISYLDPSELKESGYTHNAGEEKLSAFELLENVNTCLDLLPNRCKEIFVLSRFNQLSNNEIAEKLQISKRTVENQITHALKHLRASFKYPGIMLLALTLGSGDFMAILNAQSKIHGSDESKVNNTSYTVTISKPSSKTFGKTIF